MDQRIETSLWDDWHVVADAATLRRGMSGHRSTLFGRPLTVSTDGRLCEVKDCETGARVNSQVRYGFVWACLGEPRQDIVTFPEALEPDRIVISAGSIGIHVSGLRAAENFLDMGHFPYVHDGFLGAEPQTTVAPYKVGADPSGGLLITECFFHQPHSSPTGEGLRAEYVYRVLRPYTVALYKTNPLQPSRQDAIALMLQPVGEEQCTAHLLLMYVREGTDESAVRRFTQLIFSQDKPILENQLPRCLPLDIRAEKPVAADATSSAYRRWLLQLGVRYGAIDKELA